MWNPDLSHYGLFLANMSSQQYEGQPDNVPSEVTLTLKSSATVKPKLEQFMSDAEVMNKVRTSFDPAVKEAFEQLLTVMALTNGRTVPDELNERKPGGKAGNSN